LLRVSGRLFGDGKSVVGVAKLTHLPAANAGHNLVVAVAHVGFTGFTGFVFVFVPATLPCHFEGE
jgi:hypothetical protein